MRVVAEGHDAGRHAAEERAGPVLTGVEQARDLGERRRGVDAAEGREAAAGVLVYHARTPDLALEVPEENFDRQLGTRGEAELPVEIQFFVRFDESRALVEIVGSEDATVRTFAADVPLAEDERISRYIEGLSDSDFTRTLRYRSLSNPANFEQPLAPALDHFFNHQTHHRGQAHCLLTMIAGSRDVPSFDLVLFQREKGIGGMRQLG